MPKPEEKHKIHESLLPLKIGIDAYQLDPKNARKNHDVDGIAASLDEFEQRKPIVVNRKTGTIEAGNGTWKAAKQLGWTHIAALVVADSSKEAIKYAIADNLLTDKSVFDIPTLTELFDSIDDPMDIPGVSADWLESLGVGGEDIEVIDSEGPLSGSNYGDVRSDKIPINIMGIGGMCEREMIEKVRDKLIKSGASEDKDNVQQLSEMFLLWIEN